MSVMSKTGSNNNSIITEKLPKYALKNQQKIYEANIMMLKAVNKLSSTVGKDNMTILNANVPTEVILIEGIPSFCRVSTIGKEMPLTVKLSYEGIGIISMSATLSSTP